jgi:D-3-phosphoglycerate dehydrogenase
MKLTLVLSPQAVRSTTILNFLEQNFTVRIIQQIEEIKQIPSIDVLWIHLDCRINLTDLLEHPEIKYVITTTTGITHISEQAIHHLGNKLITLKNFQDQISGITSTAELTLNFLFFSQLNVSQINKSVLEGNWDRLSFLRETQLSSMSIGIVGLGRLGSIVAKCCHNLGMSVNFIEIDQEKISHGIESGYLLKANVVHLLESSDFVSLHADVRNRVKPLITSLEFGRIVKPITLINTARAELIDENALIQAMRQGRVRMYLADVLDIEAGNQSIRESDLWKYAQTVSNVFLTPHIGGASKDAMAKAESILCSQLSRRLGMNYAFG